MNAQEARLIMSTVKIRREIDERIRKAAEAEQSVIVVKETCNETQFVIDELNKKGFTTRKTENYWAGTTFVVSW